MRRAGYVAHTEKLICADTSLHHPVSEPSGVEFYEADCRLCPAGSEARKQCKDGKKSTDGSVLERDCSAIIQLTDCATKEDKEQVRFFSSFRYQRHPTLTLASTHCPPSLPTTLRFSFYLQTPSHGR